MTALAEKHTRSLRRDKVQPSTPLGPIESLFERNLPARIIDVLSSRRDGLVRCDLSQTLNVPERVVEEEISDLIKFGIVGTVESSGIPLDPDSAETSAYYYIRDDTPSGKAARDLYDSIRCYGMKSRMLYAMQMDEET
jgi:hypothetical protein